MRFLLLLVLLAPLLAKAGDLPAGAGCSNPNQCLSKMCSQHRCAPSGDHPSGLGGVCTSNGHCKSHYCQQGRCAAKVEKAKGSSPSGGGKRAPAEEEDDEAEVKAPTPEPLPEPTPCSEDLIATIYKGNAASRASQFAARDNCRHKPETLALAKKLFLDGYGYNFSVTLRTVHEATPEQLACAQKHYDKQKNGTFEVPGLCLKPGALIACTDELTSLFLADMKPDMARSQAQIECERRAPAVVATAKPLFVAKYGDFGQICTTVEKATPEQLECVKRDYEILSVGRTKYESFTLKGVCLRDAKTWGCYFDLFEGVLKEKSSDDRFRVSIEETCARTDPEDIALAKQILATGYTGWFPRLADDIHDLKPEKRACLKKHLAQMTSKDGLRLPKECEKK
jgi:hypothetical protein